MREQFNFYNKNNDFTKLRANKHILVGYRLEIVELYINDVSLWSLRIIFPTSQLKCSTTAALVGHIYVHFTSILSNAINITLYNL